VDSDNEFLQLLDPMLDASHLITIGVVLLAGEPLKQMVFIEGTIRLAFLE
jgi:hypothetical protein